MNAGLTTYALNAAHRTLPHNVPLVNNTKETPLRSAILLQCHKPVTPVKVDRLNFFLTGYHPPPRQFLVNGFSYGFRVGFVGNRRASQSPNLKSALEQPQAFSSKLLIELEAGRIRGPFPHPPFLEFICSPLGIVPKKSSFQISFNSTLIVPIRLFSERSHTGGNFLGLLCFHFGGHYGDKNIGGWLLYGQDRYQICL